LAFNFVATSNQWKSEAVACCGQLESSAINDAL